MGRQNNTIITYRSDSFFKYAFGRNTSDSIILRKFILEYILCRSVQDVRVDNPDLILEDICNKEVILDVYMNNQIRADIEMQNSKLNAYLRMRFQYYLSRIVSDQIKTSEDYIKLKESFQIVFINDILAESPRLINSFLMFNEKSQLVLKDNVYNQIYIHIPYILQVYKMKGCLDEFEAMVYLMSQQTLEGVQYTDRNGIIELFQKIFKEFKSHSKLMEVALMREKKMELTKLREIMEKEEREKLENEKARIEIEKARIKNEKNDIKMKKRKIESQQEDIEKQRKEIEKKKETVQMMGKKEGITELLDKMIFMKYRKKDYSLLKQCTQQQLDQIFQNIMLEKDYQDIVNIYHMNTSASL